MTFSQGDEVLYDSSDPAAVRDPLTYEFVAYLPEKYRKRHWQTAGKVDCVLVDKFGNVHKARSAALKLAPPPPSPKFVTGHLYRYQDGRTGPVRIYVANDRWAMGFRNEGQPNESPWWRAQTARVHYTDVTPVDEFLHD